MTNKKRVKALVLFGDVSCIMMNRRLVQAQKKFIVVKPPNILD